MYHGWAEKARYILKRTLSFFTTNYVPWKWCLSSKSESDLFIGPESDHCLPLSITNSLMLLRLNRCISGCWWWLIMPMRYIVDVCVEEKIYDIFVTAEPLATAWQQLFTFCNLVKNSFFFAPGFLGCYLAKALNSRVRCALGNSLNARYI